MLWPPVRLGGPCYLSYRRRAGLRRLQVALPACGLGSNASLIRASVPAPPELNPQPGWGAGTGVPAATCAVACCRAEEGVRFWGLSPQVQGRRGPPGGPALFQAFVPWQSHRRGVLHLWPRGTSSLGAGGLWGGDTRLPACSSPRCWLPGGNKPGDLVPSCLPVNPGAARSPARRSAVARRAAPRAARPDQAAALPVLQELTCTRP